MQLKIVDVTGPNLSLERSSPVGSFRAGKSRSKWLSGLTIGCTATAAGRAAAVAGGAEAQ
jgi:hypothetical protein